MIDLPTSPAPVSADAAEIDFGVLLSPPTGGEDQRVNRLGNRHRITVTMPPIAFPKVGRRWLIALKKGKKQGARMRWPLQGFDPGSPGAVLVNGGTAAGSTLPVTGATPNYVFRDGAPFSIVTGGRHYLYFNDGETIADNSGNATLTIDPPLRKQPANNDACHFGDPMIEGFIEGDEQAWSFAIGKFVSFAFAIREAR